MTTSETTAPLRFNADGQYVTDIDEGEFCYQRDAGDDRIKWLHFWPRDSLCPLSASIAPQRNDCDATWSLSGPLDVPTLTPSVNAVDVWHGFLTGGVARSV